MNERLSWGLSLSHHALPLLRQLLEHGLIDRIASPADGMAWQGGDLQGFLASEWPRSRAFVAIGACGAITRLIAPLLEGAAEAGDEGIVAAFGALHLPGEAGVLSLLQDEGFTITRLDG